MKDVDLQDIERSAAQHCGPEGQTIVEAICALARRVEWIAEVPGRRESTAALEGLDPIPAYGTLETLASLVMEYLTRGRLAKTTAHGEAGPGYADTRLPVTVCHLCGQQWDGRSDPRLHDYHDAACLVPRLHDVVRSARDVLRPWRAYRD